MLGNVVSSYSRGCKASDRIDKQILKDANTQPVRPSHRQRSDPRAISSTQPAEPICPGDDPLRKPALYRVIQEIFAKP